MAELYPICRSLTGEGVRETFSILQREIPLEVTEVPTGTQVFDWTMPREWNIKDAWIATPDGERVVDFRRSNLHVLGYSTPVRARLPLSELREHLFTHPEDPDWVPFRTSYYSENWGFCLSQRELERLPDGEYEVVIDSTLTDGNVTYAELHHPGDQTEDVPLHDIRVPPVALQRQPLRSRADRDAREVPPADVAPLLVQVSARPGTIGPLCWLWKNEDKIDRVKHGLVVSCVGDPGPPTYKQSRHENAEIDQAAANVVRAAGGTVIPFEPWGGDERQFSSPGFDLPFGALTRTPADKFPGYHSSADNLEFVRPEFLADSFQRCLEIVDVLETNGRYLNLNPKGEPQLGKRGLYRSIAGGSSVEKALLWVLNLSDGNRRLLDISDRSGIPYPAVREAAEALKTHNLITEIDA